jgi:hypothetical protein
MGMTGCIHVPACFVNLAVDCKRGNVEGPLGFSGSNMSVLVD